MATEATNKVLFTADWTFLRNRWQKNNTEIGHDLCDKLEEVYDKSELAVFYDLDWELQSSTFEDLCYTGSITYYGDTYPRVAALIPMLTKVDEVVKEKKMDSFEWVFITDGQFKESHDELLQNVKNWEFLSRITKIRFFLFGNGMPGTRAFERILSIFQGIPADVTINNLFTLEKEDPIWNKGDDIMPALKSLEQRLKELEASSETKVPVRENLDIIEEHYVNMMFRKICEEYGVAGGCPTDVIRKLLLEKDTEKVTQLISALSCAQTSDPVYVKIQKLYRKLRKGSGETYHPMHYTVCKMFVRCLCDYVDFVPPETPGANPQDEQEPEFPINEEVDEEAHENLEEDNHPKEDTQPTDTVSAGKDEDAESEKANCCDKDSLRTDCNKIPNPDDAEKDKLIGGVEMCTKKLGQGKDEPTKTITRGPDAGSKEGNTPKEAPCSTDSGPSGSSTEVGLKTQVSCGLEATMIPRSSDNDTSTEVESEFERQFRRSVTIEADKVDQPVTSTASHEPNEEEVKNEDNNEGKHETIAAEKADQPGASTHAGHEPKKEKARNEDTIEADKADRPGTSTASHGLNEEEAKNEDIIEADKADRPRASTASHGLNEEEAKKEDNNEGNKDTFEPDKADQPGTSTHAGHEPQEEEVENEDHNDGNQENNDDEDEDEEEIRKPAEMFARSRYWHSQEDQHLLPDDPQRLCAVFHIESKVHVLQLQTAPLSKIVYNDHRNPWLHRHRLQECPFRILDLIDTKKIENLILSDHVSAESYIYTVTSTEEGDDELGLSFRSTCTLNVYPIFVYNFPNPNKIDLLAEGSSELYAEKTDFDEYLVESLCAVLLQQFLSMKTIHGNKPLWAISLLYVIYKTKRVQKNSFLEECLRNTILRISIVFECNLSLFPDMYPKLTIPIKDAFTYIAKTSQVCCRSSKGCVFCRIGESSGHFIEMLQSVFHLKVPQVMCWALRISADYLYDVNKNPKAKRFLETIVKTKVQDWIDTEDGPLLLGGKTDEDVYNDCLKLTNASVLFRMVNCLKSRKTPTDLRTFADHYLNTNDTLYSEDLSYDLRLLDHVKVCSSTCRPISICPITKMPWKMCLTSDFGKPEYSFFNIYGKFCRKFKCCPYIDDMLSFLAKLYPNKVFYNNTEEVLMIIMQKFKDLNIDVAEFNERFKNSYSPAKRLEIEGHCPCPAHKLF